jgi:hypothetical protein
MTDDDGRVTQPSGEPPRVRKAVLADVFGDVLPDTTADERTPEHRGSSSEDWYQENRPPHHDRDRT